MSRPPMRPAVDGNNGRPISWPSHPTRTRSARHGFGPPLGPAGREVAVIATRAAPLHRPTASIRAATRRTAMPSAGEAEGPVPLHPPTASVRAATVSMDELPLVGSDPCRDRPLCAFGVICRPVSYTHLRAHETDSYLVCRLL